jgi:hypothetical protein
MTASILVPTTGRGSEVADYAALANELLVCLANS